MPTREIEPTPRPRLSIVPRKAWRPTNVREIWEFRGLLARFAARDITLRYRQTVLGITWVILQPLLAAGVLTFVFGSVAGLDSPAGIPYFTFSLVGMVGWMAFSQVVIRTSSSLVGNAHLVSRVYFPRVLLPLSTMVSTLVDVGAAAGLLIILLVIDGIFAGAQLVLAPVFLGLLLALALGVGLGAGALMVRYRDVQYVLPVGVQFLLFASPVAYSLASVPDDARRVYELNPIAGLLEGLRWTILDTQRPDTSLIGYSAAAALTVLVIGLLSFSRMERQFADVI